MALKDKRASLSRDEAKMVRRCMDHIESEMIDALPELTNGVKVSQKQSSLSMTIALNRAKRNNLKVSVDARVRAAREPLEFEAHLTDDNQLALGWEEEPDPAPGSGSGEDDSQSQRADLH